jgi:hypothetical protein
MRIERDNALIFDDLSIIAVKADKTGLESALNKYIQTCNLIRAEIGDSFFELIIKSKEYLDLYEANSLIFDLVDEVKRNPGLLASVVDKANYSRWIKKGALQAKFFPEKVLSEQKYGYGEGK